MQGTHGSQNSGISGMVHANQSQNVGLNGQSKRPSTQVQNRSGRVHGNSDISQKAKGDNSV